MNQGSKAEEKRKKLSDFLCFALYSANQAMQRATRPAFSELGITYPQYLVLVTLWEQDGQAVNEIGRTLLLESSTLTPIIKKLERMGLVSRERDREDERKVRVTLTREGRAMEEKTQPFFNAVVELSGLPEKGFRELQSEIVELRNRLLQATSN